MKRTVHIPKYITFRKNTSLFGYYITSKLTVAHKAISMLKDCFVLKYSMSKYMLEICLNKEIYF